VRNAEKLGRGRGKGSSSKVHALYAGALGGFAVLGASAVAGAFWLKDLLPAQSASLSIPVQRAVPEEQAQARSESAGADAAEGLGPETMEQQGPLLKRLLQLLGEVEKFTDDTQLAERRAAEDRVEAELIEIEKQIKSDTVGGSQSAALISIVRAALQSDRKGETTMGDDWSDETLQKTHGFVTYANQAYWDESYSNQRYGSSFDWGSSWTKPSLSGDSLGELVRPLVPKDAHILVLGCGNSNMSVIMHEEGYTNITNIDFSTAVIEQMQKLYGNLPGMSWLQMDASSLAFQDGTFDVVIEKSLFDALFAGTGVKAEAVLAEARRVLQPAGQLLSIAFTGERLKSLLDKGWNASSSPDKIGSQPASPDVVESGPMSQKCSIAGQLQHPKKKQDEILTVYLYRCVKA